MPASCRCSSEAISPTTRGLRLRKGQSVRLSSNSVMLSLVVTQHTLPLTRFTRTVIHTFEGCGTQYHSLTDGIKPLSGVIIVVMVVVFVQSSLLNY